MANAGIPRTPTDILALRTRKRRVDFGLDLDGVDLSPLILRAFLLPTATERTDSKTSVDLEGSDARAAMRGDAWVPDQDEVTDRIVFAGSK